MRLQLFILPLTLYITYCTAQADHLHYRQLKLLSRVNDTIVLKLQKNPYHAPKKRNYMTYQEILERNEKYLCTVEGLWTDKFYNQLTVVVDRKNNKQCNVTYITALSLGPKQYKGESKAAQNQTVISVIMRATYEKSKLQKFVQIGCGIHAGRRVLFVVVLPLTVEIHDAPALYKFSPSAMSSADIVQFYLNKKYDLNNGTLCRLKGDWMDPLGNCLRIKIIRAIMSTKGYSYHLRLILNREKYLGKVEGIASEPNIALRMHSEYDASNIIFAVVACDVIYDQKKLMFTYGRLNHNPKPQLQLIYFDLKERPTEKIFNSQTYLQLDQNFKDECPLLGNWTDTKSTQLHIGLMNYKPTKKAKLTYYSVLTLTGVKFLGTVLGEFNRSTLSMYVSCVGDPDKEILFTAACREVTGHNQVALTLIPYFKRRPHKPKFLYLHDENKIVKTYHVNLIFEAMKNVSREAFSFTGNVPAV